jgi:hypothetical protein
MSQNRYRITGKQLVVIDDDGAEHIVDFDAPVVQALMSGRIIVLRTESAPGVINNENVYGVALEGHIVWRLKAQKQIYADSPYTGMTIVDGGIRLFNWDGTELLVNPNDGGIIQETYGK